MEIERHLPNCVWRYEHSRLLGPKAPRNKDRVAAGHGHGPGAVRPLLHSPLRPALPQHLCPSLGLHYVVAHAVIRIPHGTSNVARPLY